MQYISLYRKHLSNIDTYVVDELPSSSPHVLPPANGAGGSPPDTGGQISNPATDAPAPIPPPVPASAPVPTAPSPPSPTLPPHISQPPVSKSLQIFVLLLQTQHTFD